MRIIKKRVGRLNTIEFFDNGIVRKTSSLEERGRPNRLLREAVVLEMAASRGLRVPELLAYGRDSRGSEYLDTRIIAGVSLVPRACGDRIRVFATVGSQMLKLRACLDGFGWLNGETKKGEYLSWKQFLRDFYERYRSRISDHDLSESLRVREVRNLIDELVAEPLDPYVIHRDLKPRNVIWDNEGLTWILDWENAVQGDPLFDLAQFAANFGHGEQWKALVSGYGLDVSTRCYSLYEIIALTGVIAFCEQHQVPCAQRRERMRRRLVEL